MRKVVAALAVVVFVLLATGCTSLEDPDQARARRSVEDVVAGNTRYPGEPIHCTHTPRAWLVERKASQFLCAVQLGTGFCDLYVVTFLDGGSKKVRLRTRKGDCTLTI